MAVKTKGDKNQIKMSLLSEGKVIVRDVVVVLKELEMVFKEALNIGDKRLLKKLPVRIKITLKDVKKLIKYSRLFSSAMVIIFFDQITIY